MQSDFLSKITETESILPKLVLEINASGLPLLFYGAGDYAQLLYSAVDAYDLHISDVVVTSKSDNTSVFMGYEIQAIQDALGKYNKCNVLIAFQNSAAYEMAQIETNLLNSGKVAKVYYYDAVHSNYNSDLNLEYNFVVENQHILNNLYNILHDDFSRDVLTGFFNQRISGDTHYLKNLCTNDQYFPDFIKLQDNETFVDCGAYDGDSIESFVRNMGSKRIAGIYAFEPDEKSFSKLMTRKFTNITAIKKGCYSRKSLLRFSGSGNPGSVLTDFGNSEVEVDAIDNVLQGKTATYIKMDVEGSEFECIKGAKNTILSYKPKLGISAYHKNEDLITIPWYITDLVPEYKLFLRHHHLYSVDTVLYAIV